jgi:hypothetical protein
MQLIKQFYKILLGLFILICFCSLQGTSQRSVLSDPSDDSVLYIIQQKALELLSRQDTSASPFWPRVKPALYFANVRKNIEFPNRINQGSATNFCGYASLTHLLIKYHPDIYCRKIMELYRSGEMVMRKKALKPSERVRKAAGTLKNKGELDILHADQLWFLTLADQFKGYMNIFDHKYDPGDENKMWAGTNLKKFNRMLMDFTRDSLTLAGSDFIRPWKKSFYDYISNELQSGIVLLFVNSKYLYPHKYSLFKLRAPTHFIVLYDMYKVGDMIEIRYWDYGLKTEQLITGKRLKKLIFGVTTITDTNHEAL